MPTRKPKQQPQTLFDLASDNGPVGGMTLEEALAQVDELNDGDEELKEIIRRGYSLTAPKKNTAQ